MALENGWVLRDITPGDFEPKTVLGNTQSPEFQMLDEPRVLISLGLIEGGALALSSWY